MNDNITNSSGDIIFFSFKYFVEQIVEQNACFICGAKRGTKTFNKEHVVPDWIIKKHNLSTEWITLLNEQKISYPRYKIPCCKECNSKLAAFYENPIRQFFDKSFEDRIEFLKNHPDFEQKLFQWIGLIFCKIHLFDTQMRFNQNPTIDSPIISSFYNWKAFHILHSIVKNIDENLKIEAKYSTSLIFKSEIYNDEIFNYDYLDNFETMTCLLRIGDMTFIVSFFDFCLGYNNIKEDIIDNLNNPLNMFQGLEIYSRIVSFLSSKRIERNFIVSENKETYSLKGEVERIYDLKGGRTEDILLHYLGSRLDGMKDSELIKNKIMNEGYSFL